MSSCWNPIFFKDLDKENQTLLKRYDLKNSLTVSTQTLGGIQVTSSTKVFKPKKMWDYSSNLNLAYSPNNAFNVSGFYTSNHESKVNLNFKPSNLKGLSLGLSAGTKPFHVQPSLSFRNNFFTTKAFFELPKATLYLTGATGYKNFTFGTNFKANLKTNTFSLFTSAAQYKITPKLILNAGHNHLNNIASLSLLSKYNKQFSFVLGGEMNLKNKSALIEVAGSAKLGNNRTVKGKFDSNGFLTLNGKSELFDNISLSGTSKINILKAKKLENHQVAVGLEIKTA
ncbi:hypothetical protein M0812_24640 [Anaeramoeba flamelloides]|uniref:Autotransporter domain-containing protein n=1 Tax=Anaeramoeba flamelloides TaxID=1746091 RepID=A0AAV7YMV9_9EUKA|nr:hypothetical protein M0812_24640 [Anaeramoeba flamelloides]